MNRSASNKYQINIITLLIVLTLLLSSVISATNTNNLQIKMGLEKKELKISPYEQISRSTTEFIKTDTPGTPILIEDFEYHTMPPPGWTHQKTNTNDNYTWHIHNQNPYEGRHSANCFYDPDLNQQNEWLITPSLDFSGYTSGIYLSFRWIMSYHWSVSPYDNYDFNVKISTDGGSTWTLLWNEETIGKFENWEWYDTTFKTPVDLSAYADKTHVLIGFQYEGIFGAQLSIDLVEIYACAAHDVGATKINLPLETSTLATGNITPSIMVKNYGAFEETDVPVNLNIIKRFEVGEIEDFEHEILGDLNHDGEVTNQDYDIFNGTFGLNENQPGFVKEADYNNNGTIENDDRQMWLYYSMRYSINFPIFFGDLSHDGVINETDYLMFLASFEHSVGDPEYNPEADYNKNGIVNLDDYEIWDQHKTNYENRYTHAVGPSTGPGWFVDDWEWGKPTYGPPSAYSGNLCWGTNLDGNLRANGNMVLDSIEFNLSELSASVIESSTPHLEFHHWYDFSTPYYYSNGGNVKISTDNGENWSVITPINGYPMISLPPSNPAIAGEPGYWKECTEDWTRAAFNLSEYMNNETVQFRWHCGTSSSSSYRKAGWYIDNVRVVYIDNNKEYNETISVDMSSRGNQEVTFPEWTPSDWRCVEDRNIEYDITTSTELYNDEDFSNNDVEKSVIIHFPFFNDTGIISINNPTGTINAGPITPMIKVANFGQQDQYEVPVKMYIKEITYNHSFEKEDFETGLPENWEIIDEGNTYDTWTDTNPGERTPEGGCEGTFMIVDSDYAGFLPIHLIESLITPSINCNHTYTKICLRFNQFYNHVKDDYAQVDVSGDGGNSWTNVATYYEDIKGQTTIDITNIAAGSDNVKIRFYYNDACTFAWYWMIDNVEVFDMSYSSFGYNKTEYIDLLAGEQKEIRFPEWNQSFFEPDPTERIRGRSNGYKEVDYYVDALTSLQVNGIIDKDLTNDQKEDQVTLIFFNDVGVESITQPTPPMPSRKTIFTEGFENTWVSDSDGDLAPPGWENHITDDSDTGPPNHLPYHWGQYGTIPYYNHPVEPHNGSYQAFVQWNESHQDEWLISPVIDLFDYENCKLSFWRYGATGSEFYDHYYVKVSPTGGSNKADFTDIIWDATDLPEGYNYYDTPYIIDLSEYDGLSIRIAWQNVDGSDNDGLYYASCIDDIKITGEITGAYPPDTYPVEAIVKNHGSYEEDFEINASIYQTNGTQDILVYNSQRMILDLPSNATEKILFDDWTLSDLGIYRLEIRAFLQNDTNLQDNIKTKIIRADNKPPTTTLTSDGIQGENGWYIDKVIVSLDATDDLSGVLANYYEIGNGLWKLYTNPFKIVDDGNYIVEYFSVDYARNIEEVKSTVIKIDKEPPTITLDKKTRIGRVIFTAEVNDETSGIDRVEFYLEESLEYTATEEPYEWTWHGIGDHTVTAIVYDVAGHSDQSSSSTSLIESHSKNQDSNLLKNEITSGGYNE